jgi:hypothetical protein
MVGDSETNDIEPARARGMLAVRVALEEPPPSTTSADYVGGSLHDVAEVLFGLFGQTRRRLTPERDLDPDDATPAARPSPIGLVDRPIAIV